METRSFLWNLNVLYISVAGSEVWRLPYPTVPVSGNLDQIILVLLSRTLPCIYKVKSVRFDFFFLLYKYKAWLKPQYLVIIIVINKNKNQNNGSVRPLMGSMQLFFFFVYALLYCLLFQYLNLLDFFFWLEYYMH